MYAFAWCVATGYAPTEYGLLLKALPSVPERQLPLATRLAVSPAPFRPALTALMTSLSSRKLLLRAAVLNHAPWRGPPRAAPWSVAREENAPERSTSPITSRRATMRERAG